MRKLLLLGVMIFAVLLLSAPASLAKASPVVEISLLNPPPGDLLELAVGEIYTFDIQITSDEPFIIAMAMTDAYYPGRGVFWHGGDRATHDTEALLHLTITGRMSTADLPAVCDWPEPATCWPAGVVPISIAAGVRFRGGAVVSQIFPFAVVVP